jgi:opacity protein-like surface antigen
LLIILKYATADGIGCHRFPAKIGSALDLYQFSANGKYYLTSSGPFRPFVNGGIGGYKFSGNSTYFGGNFGGGILYELGPHWGLQGSYNFHAVNTPGAATKFSTVQGGIRFVF